MGHVVNCKPFFKHDSLRLIQKPFKKPNLFEERLMETSMILHWSRWECRDFFIGNVYLVAGDLLYTVMLFLRFSPRLLWWDDQYLWRDSRETRDHWEGFRNVPSAFHCLCVDACGCILKHLPPNINEPSHDSQEIRSLLEERDELVKAIAELQSQLDEVNLSNKASVKAWENPRNGFCVWPWA